MSSQKLGRNSPISRDPPSASAGQAVNNEDDEAREPELEELRLSEEQKGILKETWQIIYSQMGHALSYVGGHGAADGAENGGVAETFLKCVIESKSGCN